MAACRDGSGGPVCVSAYWAAPRDPRVLRLASIGSAAARGPVDGQSGEAETRPCARWPRLAMLRPDRGLPAGAQHAHMRSDAR